MVLHRSVLSCFLGPALALVVGACGAPGDEGAGTDENQGALSATAWRLPGEFEPVDELLVTWSDGVDASWKKFTLDVVKAASAEASVLVVAATDPDHPETSPAMVAHARAALASAGVNMARVRVTGEALDTNWIRDFGPEIVRGPEGKRRVAKSTCCGDDDRANDEALAQRLAKDALHMDVVATTLALQGGNLQSDGEGRCITTDAMVDDNDNNVAEVKRALAASFGCTHVFVLPALEDESNGHVDMLATITGPAEVIVGQATVAEDPANVARLDHATALLSDGGFRVRRIPMPRRDKKADPALGGTVFPSYTNAVAVNGAVLVPVFAQDRTHEAAALAVFRDAYPGRRVIPVESGAMIAFGGAIHCATMTVAK